MADIFHYIAEDAAHCSTVKAMEGGDYYIERSRRGRRGRIFQTLEEWMARMKGRGYFTMPDWTRFRAVRDAYLPLTGSFYYEDPECRQENRSLIFLRRRGLYVQHRHGATYFATFADWAATLPVGGRLYAANIHLSTADLFWQYRALYERTEAKADAAHYLAYFLLVNKDELRGRQSIRPAIRTFLADARFEYNNALLDRVHARYWDNRAPPPSLPKS